MDAWEAAANNPFVQLAHALLKRTPGAAFDGEPFMLTALDGPEGSVVCSCFYHTVVITSSYGIVFSNDAGGMRPIDDAYLDKAFDLAELSTIQTDWFERFRTRTSRLMDAVKQSPAVPA